jgi:hypothetical protein
MAGEDWDEEDAALSDHILGTPDRDEAIASIRNWLVGQGQADADVMSIELSVGAAVEVRLCDGSKLFAKFWSPSVRQSALAAQLHVQDALARRGFPAPRLRSTLAPFRDGCAVLMDFDRGGAPTDVRIPGVMEAMAHGLARLVREGRELKSIPGLPEHSLPVALWPKPHNVLFDFEATAQGAEWIDAIARRDLDTLRARRGSQVLGHLDWSAKNMRMRGLSLAVVYDWDAIFVADETYVVGSAAVTFPTTWELPVPAIPTLEQTVAFIAAYEVARGRPFELEEHERIRAAASYSQCYTARCDYAVDPHGASDRWASFLGQMTAR